jgi:hypothetical protein
MIYLTLTTLVLYVILGSISGWFARALYDFEKSEENRRPKPVSAKGTGGPLPLKGSKGGAGMYSAKEFRGSDRSVPEPMGR